MIEQATDGEHSFDVILVHSFSRFYRDNLYSELYIRKLRKANVRVISITQPSSDDPAGNLIRNIISLFDEHQSHENGKHVLRSMKENARQGFYNGSPLPLGYTTEFVERRGNKDKKKIVVDPVEAELVRVIFDLYTKGDGNSSSLGVKEIVSRLNRNGFRTRRGNLFGVSGIHNLLQNKIYIGEYTFNKTCSKTNKSKDASEHICIEVDPIISRSQFDDVQSLLKKTLAARDTAQGNDRANPPYRARKMCKLRRWDDVAYGYGSKWHGASLLHVLNVRTLGKNRVQRPVDSHGQARRTRR